MKSIKTKMLAWFGVTLGSLMVVFGILTYFSISGTVLPLTRDLGQEILRARSAEVGRLISGYLSEVKTIAGSDLMRSGNYEAIGRFLMRRADSINPDFEIVFVTDSKGNYITSKGARGNVAEREYWKAIMVHGQPFAISGPLLSKSTGENMFAVASVIANDQGDRIGVAAATVQLQKLSEIVTSIKLGRSGAGWVVDRSGVVIAHPNPALPMKLNLLHSDSAGYRGLEAIGQRIAKGESGQGRFVRPDGTHLVAIFNPIPDTPGWAFGISMNRSEYMERPEKLIRQIVWLLAAMLVVVLAVVVMLSRRISTPVRLLREGVEVVGSGQLDHVLDIRTGDEIQALAEAFNRMTGELKEHVARLTETTAAKERIESELKVARRIQASTLPRIFPPFPSIEHLDLFATMEPARDVGGDFFDFFVQDERYLYFYVGDVSGKGVPAALFMVITMTILRHQAVQSPDLDELFYRANNMLCAENDEGMFVTVFMGMLDLKNGELRYINAGHNPPLIKRAGREWAFLTVSPGLVMGAVEEFGYASATTALQPGDMLFLYTDGITEAIDGNGEFFGPNRTVAALNAFDGKSTRELVTDMRHTLKLFTGDIPPADDVTMLALFLTGLPTHSGQTP